MSTKEDALSRSKMSASPGARLEQIKQELARERRRITGSAVVTLIVGVIVLGAISFYFVYGYKEIRKLANPNDLVSYLESEVNQRLPQWRQQGVDQVKANAPKLAADLSKQALDNIPTGRKKLEEFALQRYDESANEVIHLTDDEFRKFLKANHAKLDRYFKDLAKNPKLAEEDLNELAKSMEEQLELDMKLGARQLLETLVEVNMKMKALRANKNLTPEEQTERRLMLLARRIELQNDPAKLAQFPKAEELPRKVTAMAKKPVPPTAVKDSGPAPKPGAEGKKASPDAGKKPSGAAEKKNK